MVERMYGVSHGASLELMGTRVEDIVVHPSSELLDGLRELHRGATVGLEWFPEISFEVPGIKTDVVASNRFYWDRIIEVCRTCGLQTVFLDDPRIYKEYLEKLMEVEELIDADKVGDGKLRTRLEAVYKAETEAEYIHVVKREERLLENIRKSNPRVVILGLGHTDYLLANPELLKKAEIDVDSYKREEPVSVPRVTLADVTSGYPLEVETHIVDGMPNQRIVLARELLQRRYNAVTQWRIIPQKEPSFIGTWDRHCRTRGLFEVYLDDSVRNSFLSFFQNILGQTVSPKQKNSIAGFIEDVLGTAFFVGEVNAGSIRFRKIYIPDKSGQEAVDKPVLYEGTWTGGRYEGVFTVVSDRNDTGRKFFLNQGAEFIH